MKKWWIIDIKKRYAGKCYATEEEIKKACGPYIEVTGNSINIFAPPPK